MSDRVNTGTYIGADAGTCFTYRMADLVRHML